MKKIYLLAMALAAMVSCTSDDFVGDTSSPTSETGGADAIQFKSNAGKITRATQNTGTAAVMLDGQFKVYGVKSGSTAGSGLQKVFTDYGVWAASGSGSSTTSNSSGWEYVEPSATDVNHAPSGSANTMNVKNQTIKYWDHSAADYRFVAGSPFGAFTFNINSSNNAIQTATVTGLAGHINPNSTATALSTEPVYIAEPLIIEESDYATSYGGAPVTFNFVRQQARVRVGVYETIPGYKITNITFYPYGTNSWSTTPSENIVLASTTSNYFVGGASDAVKGTITYNWTTTPASYTFQYEAAENKELTQQNNWYAGKLNATSWEMAITSTESSIAKFYGADTDMDATTGYFTVIPTPTGTTAQPILIKCDYTLTSEVDNSGETINIHGATAAVPAAFSKWAPNTSYTYLFKISDNTNGKTDPNKDPVGLFPITFDAVAVAENSTEQGYITTVSTPSITTYQDGSVTETGIKYVPGESKVIYFTVQGDTNGTLKSLNTTEGSVGCVKVFWLGTTAKTEADLQVTPPTSSDVLSTSNPSGSTALALPNSAWSHNGQSIASGSYGTFTPGAEGYYAIQYLTTAASGTQGENGYVPAAYTYKVVHVETAAVPSGSRD